MIKNKKEYIELYNKRIKKYIPTFRKEHSIDEDFIYCKWLKEKLKFKIDDIVTLLNFYTKVKNYIYDLKVGGKILINQYGDTEIVTITKINYKRKNKYNLPYKNKISSFKVKANSNFEYKIKKDVIVFKDIKFYDLVDVCLHFYNYLFFSEYDIRNANEILEKLNLFYQERIDRAVVKMFRYGLKPEKTKIGKVKVFTGVKEVTRAVYTFYNKFYIRYAKTSKLCNALEGFTEVEFKNLLYRGFWIIK